MKNFPKPFIDFFNSQNSTHRRKPSDENLEDILNNIPNTERSMPSCKPIIARPSESHGKYLKRNSSNYYPRRK